jgi:GntR family transcriptional regulator/MocR family aminotransferase
MTSKQAEQEAANHGIEVLGLDRFTLKHRHVEGLLLGFAAFDEDEIRRGVISLTAALERSVTRRWV